MIERGLAMAREIFKRHKVRDTQPIYGIACAAILKLDSKASRRQSYRL